MLVGLGRGGQEEGNKMVFFLGLSVFCEGFVGAGLRYSFFGGYQNLGRVKGEVQENFIGLIGVGLKF